MKIILIIKRTTKFKFFKYFIFCDIGLNEFRLIKNFFRCNNKRFYLVFSDKFA